MSAEKLGEIIILALLDALRKESEIYIRMKILDALDKCIQILLSCFDESNVSQFIDCILEGLLVCSHTKIKRKGGFENNLNLREKRLLKKEIKLGNLREKRLLEEIKLENDVCKAIADCLGSIFKISKFPCLALMRVISSTEDTRAISILLGEAAWNYGEDDYFKHCEGILVPMFRGYNLQNRDVWQIIVHGICVCAEFGGNTFKPHLEEAISALDSILKNAEAKHPNHWVAHDIAVVALSKICKFHYDDPNAYQALSIWLGYLPLRNNLKEAILMHDDLCTVIEKFENKVLGVHARYNDFSRIIIIFTEIIFSGNILATDETLNRMKKILRFQRKRLPSLFETICTSFPLPKKTMLMSCLA